MDSKEAISSVEKGGVSHPEEPRSETPATNRNCRVYFALAAVLILAVIIGLSVGLTREKENEDTIKETVPTFESSSGTFDVRLPLFSKSLATSYTSNDDLIDDLIQVLKLYVNGVIQRNKDREGDFRVEAPEVGAPGGGDTSLESGSVDAPDSSPSAEGVDDYGTNNQEEGVDEADLVKSDGTYVFSAAGDVILVWEAETGLLVTNITLDPVVMPGSGGQFTTEVLANVEPASSFSPGIFRPKVQGLLLTSARLVVVVSGYGPSMEVNRLHDRSSLLDRLATRVLVFNTSTLTTENRLTKLHEKDISGTYRDARSIGNDVHIVTGSGFDYWSALVNPLGRYLPRFYNMTDSEYVQEARRVAELELIPDFAARIVDDISAQGSPSVAKVGIWQTIQSNSTIEDMLYGQSPAVNSYTQVASFNVLDEGNELALSFAGVFMPSSWGHTYTVPGMLLFAAQGWNWIPELEGAGETTYFMGFALNGATAEPAAVGFLPGNLLNQFSLDIFNGHIRAATTIRNLWTPSVMSIMPVLQQTAQNQVVFLRIPGEIGEEPGVLEEVGRIPNLGKEFEVFTTVRFFDKIAYAVTFQRTDPFYVLDVEDPENPGVLGELSITGFSSYLHSINANNTLLLAVGQEADDSGFQLGVQVTIFDASDPSNPTALRRHVAETDRETWSDSAVQWNHKAFRYVELAPEAGILILPMNIRNWDDHQKNFDGFVVYDINKDAITPRFNITHASGEDFWGCYYWARFPQRSLVFNGNVTTMKGRTVISTDLDTGMESWRLDLLKPQNWSDCYYW